MTLYAYRFRILYGVILIAKLLTMKDSGAHEDVLGQKIIRSLLLCAFYRRRTYLL